MTPSTRLSIEGLGKRYWLRRAAAPSSTPSRFDRVRRFFSIPQGGDPLNAKELWALKDVSLSVDPGSVLGIVGSNGAGKTTLLKILAKVIAPTTGRVSGRGRVVSLLELGAGFDDEATARENIYMNAALNGIPRDVVERRFNQIIEFAELQEFVDTPVHLYSSGMYLRLAFSVAINMEPSILLADEILAVGDAVFQERCLHKVHELAREQGLTVLFVSHDMEAITRICDRVIWLKEGGLHRDGPPDEVVTEYQNAAWELLTKTSATELTGSSYAGKYGEIVEVKLMSADGREIGSPPRHEDAYIRVRFRTHRAKTRVRCAIELLSKGVLVLRSTQPSLLSVSPDQAYEARVKIPGNLLADTAYTVNAAVTLIRGEEEVHALVKDRALAFMVYGDQDVNALGTSLQRKGVVDPELSWTVELEPNVVAPESVIGEWAIEPRHSGVFARLAELWQYRHLLGYFARRALQAVFLRTSLGWLWMTLRVTAPIGLNTIIFGSVLDVKSNGVPYFLFLLCGQTVWTLFDRSLLFVTRSIERNRKLISKVYFPRLILPISAVSPALVFLMILTLVLLASNAYFRYQDGAWYIPLHPRLLLAPVAVLISLAFAVAIGFWSSVLQAQHRDIRFGLQYSLTFFIFATTVLYPLSQIKHPLLRWMVYLNPMESAIELFRFATLGMPLELNRVTFAGQLIAIAMVGLTGVWFFNREEAASVDKL